MHAVNRCDFCESDAVGTFEIVPSALEPTDAEQRRLLLCEGCRNRLEGVLEPFIARLRDGPKPPATGADAAGVESAPVDGEETPASAAVTFESADTTEPVDADDADADSPDDEQAGDADTPEDPPAGYAAVMRLLRNRAEPMERSAVESLAASAYDLESHEVDAVIDHALEHGDLREENGTIRRP